MFNLSNPSTIISLISFLFSFLFFIFLLFRSKENSAVKILALVMLNNSIWMALNFLASQNIFDISTNIILWRADFAIAAFIPLTILFFIFSLLNKPINRLLTALFFIVFLPLFFMTQLSPLIISGAITTMSGFVDYQKGSLFIIYALAISVLTFTTYVYLIRSYLKSEKKSRLHSQLRSVGIAMTVPVVLASVTNLIMPALGISFPRLANLSLIPFIYFMARAIKKDNILQTTSGYFNIRAKIIFGFLISSIIPILFITSFGFNFTKKQLTETTYLAAAEDIERHVSEIDGELDLLKKELIFLSGTPPIQGIIRAQENDGFDQVENSSYEQWVARLNMLFSQRIMTKNNFMQLRFIDEFGDELVRVDSKGDQVVVAVQDQLQNKKDRYYFTDSIGLLKGQVYISDLDLNKEGTPSKVEVPFKPTIRLATPVFDQDNNRQGIVIINTLANDILNNLRNDSHTTATSQKMSLVDSAGFYLVNPDEKKEWGGPRDLDTGVNFLTDYPEFEDEFLSAETGEITSKNYFYTFSSYQIKSSGNENNRWFFINKIPKKEIFVLLTNLQNLVIKLLVVFISLIIVWAIFFSKVFSKPILALKKGALIITGGDLDHSVATNSKDEIGDLSRVFDEMTVAIKKSRSEINQKVDEQTKKIQKSSLDLSNQRQAILNVLEDVEAEKQLAEEQSQELEKFKLAVRQASDHIVITDSEGVALYANPAVEKITGYKAEEIIGKKVGTKELWGGLMKDDFYKTFWKTVKIDKQIFVGELSNQRKDGQKYTAHASISPVLDNEGEVIFFVGIERDITHEKEVDRMKTEFISLASHQLRTPLSAMKWFLEMLLAGDAGKLNKEQREMIDNVDQSNQRMIALVNGLLNISRIESGRIIVEPEPTDLSALIKELLVELEPKIKEKELTVIVSQNEKMGKILVDPSLILEVYRNLLTNAIKYTRKKGEITVFISKDDQNVISQVSDDGLGIPKEDQSKVFEKFHRGANVLKTETDGTGLGLYLTKAVVESSKGKIWFESEENKGTTFWFTLPLAGMTAKEGEVRLGNGKTSKQEVKKKSQNDTKEIVKELTSKVTKKKKG